jgi:catechol 2,3-dioxygenase-like lactoylglutathione lyase family enzyme
MFTRIDHVVICVPDLDRGIEQYSRLGFNVVPGGSHPGRGTLNAIAYNDEEYIELLALRDAEEAARSGYDMDRTLSGFIASGGGIRHVVVQSNDLEADVAAMRARGVDVGDAMRGSRITPSGGTLEWKLALPGPSNPLPIFFIEHLTPLEERRAHAARPEGHPNGVYALERTYIVTDDARSESAVCARVLGMPQPPLQRGTVIMADMAVFQLGTAGFAIVEPYAPGPAADALERRGPGPFQALYRTTSMSAAARWIQNHGIGPLPRGTRNTGEQAMLAGPDIACGAFIGFVGPE